MTLGFDAGSSDAQITLSNLSRTATAGGAGTGYWALVNVTPAGKQTFQITYNTANTFSDYDFCGMRNAASSFWGMFPLDRSVYVNSSLVGTLSALPAFAAGDTVEIAWDTTAGKFWIRSKPSAGSFSSWYGWNGSAVVVGDPVAGTNGFTVGATGTTPKFGANVWTGHNVTGEFDTATTSGYSSLSGATLGAALTGLSATGSRGTLAPAISVSLVGAAATGAVGAFGFGKALTGNLATGSLGTLTPAISKALTGSAATGSAGNLSPSGAISVALTGLAATGSTGVLTANISRALTGQAATASRGSLSTLLSIGLVGRSAAGGTGTFGLQVSGAVALAGVTATGLLGTLTAVGPVPVAHWTPEAPATGSWATTSATPSTWTPEAALPASWTPS